MCLAVLGLSRGPRDLGSWLQHVASLERCRGGPFSRGVQDLVPWPGIGPALLWGLSVLAPGPPGGPCALSLPLFPQ